MTTDSPPPTFSLFPRLPTELQAMIWRCALPGPRIIQVHYLSNSFSFNGARPPPVLHTCRRSREVALSVFEPAFTRNNELAPIYINPAHDTLHLTTAPKMCKHTASVYSDIKEKIQSLAVEISSEKDLEDSVVDIKLSHLNKIREIIFVVRYTEASLEKLLEFKYPEYVRFSEPEATAPFPWKRWNGWMELVFKVCVVRVVEAKGGLIDNV